MNEWMNFEWTNDWMNVDEWGIYLDDTGDSNQPVGLLICKISIAW